MSRLGFLCLLLTIFCTIDNVRAQTCTSGECSASYFDPDLTLSPNRDCYANTDEVALSCAGNMGGPDTNLCNNGVWALPSATCEVFTCSKPNIGDGLNVTPDEATYAARDGITYTCDQGYTLTGATAATCDAQDTWNPTTVPTCTIMCEVPTIRNGHLTTSGPFSEGDTALVNCNEGSDLKSGDSSIINCQSDGTWDNVPECFLRCNVSAVENSNTAQEISISHGSVTNIVCQNGYSYEQETSFPVTCEDGVLSGVVPEKCYQDCTLPSSPANGEVIGSDLHGESIEFNCDRGYGTNATVTDTCEDGVWENGGVTPTCYELSLTNSISLYCNPDKFIVEIPGGLLGGDVGVESVTLGGCQGSYYDGEYLFVNSSYTECGTTAEVDEVQGQIVYSNTVRSAATTDIITTQESLTINVDCAFDQDNIVSSSAVVQGSVSEDLEGNGQFEMVFAAYAESDYSNEITGDDRVNTNDLIYLRAEVIYVRRVDLFPIRCYATPEPSSSYFRFADLIDEGCPTSSYVSNLRSDTSTNQNFAFDMNVFRFTDSDSDSIYIHCELKICPSDDYECPLPENCPAVSRRKRASQITLSRRVSAGPIRITGTSNADTNSSSGGWQSMALTVYSATVSLVLLCAVVVVGVLVYRRRHYAPPGYSRTGKI